MTSILYIGLFLNESTLGAFTTCSGRNVYMVIALFGKLSFLKLSRDLSWHIFHMCHLVLSFSLL